ncbi:MAG: glycine cleavage system aminomethyltransferase GcvT [Calditrichaeota bacterium]|nr:MAG: glycine cleavage system aminomethyltransferase GcvT [Calditrichota bacterium]
MKKTALYSVHLELGAKMAPFAGYWMPIQYAGILQEHRCVRTQVGLFDVSHMGEFIVRGKNALDFLQKITINDVSKLQVNQVQYTAMCYENGGIVDDLLVYRFDDYYMMVVNAANVEKDWNWAKSHLLDDVVLQNQSDQFSLLALQGPFSRDLLQQATSLPLDDLAFYWSMSGVVADVPMIVSRTGYTGELGYELCFAPEHTEKIWHTLMAIGEPYKIEPIGLGARDTLRLEMKYCLYGNDIDATTHPLEAGLGWITKLDKPDFIGKAAILQAKNQGLTRKLVGFMVKGKAFPRHGYELYRGPQKIGFVTSGTFSPMLEKGIGMGYVESEFSNIGSTIEIDIRGKRESAEIVKTPFYQHK